MRCADEVSVAGRRSGWWRVTAGQARRLVQRREVGDRPAEREQERRAATSTRRHSEKSREAAPPHDPLPGGIQRCASGADDGGRRLRATAAHRTVPRTRRSASAPQRVADAISFTTETDFQNGTWIDGELVRRGAARAAHEGGALEARCAFGSRQRRGRPARRRHGGRRLEQEADGQPSGLVREQGQHVVHRSSLPAGGVRLTRRHASGRIGKLFGQRPRIVGADVDAPPPAARIDAAGGEGGQGIWRVRAAHEGLWAQDAREDGMVKGQASGQALAGRGQPARGEAAAGVDGYGVRRLQGDDVEGEAPAEAHPPRGRRRPALGRRTRSASAQKQQAQAPPGERPKNWKKHERRQLNLKSAAKRREQRAAAAAAPAVGAGPRHARPQVRLHASDGRRRRRRAADTEPPPPAILARGRRSGAPRDLDDLELAKRERALKQERDALAALTQRRDALASAARQRSASPPSYPTCATPSPTARRRRRRRRRATATRSPTPTARRWARLRAAAPAELPSLASTSSPSAVAPGARALYAADSLEQPALGVEAMRRWQRALAPLPGGGGARVRGPSGGPSGGPELAYEALIHCVVLPPVRRARQRLGLSASPISAAAALLERWRPLLPGSAVFDADRDAGAS